MGGEWGQGVPIRGAPGWFARETQAVLVVRTTGKGKEGRQGGQGASHLSCACIPGPRSQEGGHLGSLQTWLLWFREFSEGPSGDGGLVGPPGVRAKPGGDSGHVCTRHLDECKWVIKSVLLPEWQAGN